MLALPAGMAVGDVHSDLFTVLLAHIVIQFDANVHVIITYT
jgi:hypothetical protein